MASVRGTRQIQSVHWNPHLFFLLRDAQPFKGNTRCTIQNNTFTAHCIARGPPCAITGLPASTSGVDAIVPKELLRTFVLCAEPRLTRFSRLKISHRAWMRVFAFTLNVLMMFRSHCASPGSRALFRPQVPSMPGAGSPNACDAFVMNLSGFVKS